MNEFTKLLKKMNYEEKEKILTYFETLFQKLENEDAEVPAPEDVEEAHYINQ